MAAHIALLKGVNVGGRKVLMAELRAMMADLGFADVQTLLQSGNLVFTGGTRNGAALEAFLEEATAERFGIRTDYFVRTSEEWRATIAANPYAEEAERDAAHLLVMALKRPPEASAVEDLRAAITGSEYFQVVGREAFIVFPDGIGESRLITTVIDRKLGVRGTGRNWNTVLKLAALAEV